ncbi:Lactate utilization protein B [compost metagenome]
MEKFQMKAAGRLLSSPSLFGKTLRFAHPASRLMSRHGRIVRGPGLIHGWIDARDLSQPVKQQDSFRVWLDKRKGESGQ